MCVPAVVNIISIRIYSYIFCIILRVRKSLSVYIYLIRWFFCIYIYVVLRSRSSLIPISVSIFDIAHKTYAYSNLIVWFGFVVIAPRSSREMMSVVGSNGNHRRAVRVDGVAVGPNESGVREKTHIC